jgi:DNA-binding NarL/FixJ family response regulator
MPEPSTATAQRGPVLVIGARAATRAATAAIDDSALPRLSACSTELACSRQWSSAPRAIVLCTGALSRRHAREVSSLCVSFPETPVMLVSPEVERWELRCALDAGAAGVLVDDNSLPCCLIACIEAALAGQVCVPRHHRRQLVPPALSAREKQILGLVVMGFMNCQIAEQLFLAESTVKSHLSSAFGKLGVRSRNEAASLILDPDRGLGMGILGLSGEGGRTRPGSVDDTSVRDSPALLSV